VHAHCVCLVFGAIAIAAATGSADGEITRGKKRVAECMQFSVRAHILSHRHDCMQMHVTAVAAADADTLFTLILP
jgi:hypothetical protein